jgi:hypothetical protein
VCRRGGVLAPLRPDERRELTMASEERKIIIDEGWKAQVEREREEARVASASVAEPQPAAEAATAKIDDLNEAGPAPEDIEPSSFEGLISGLGAQAMMALGLLLEEGQTQVYVDLALAKHLIDTMMMLREKTKGNVTQHESTMLTRILADLQHAFAARAQQVQESALRGKGIDPLNLKGELR